MSIALFDDLAAATYKIICLVTAFGFAYLGYRLFVQGIFGDAGHLEASFNDNKLLLKKAAPGTFFAVLGAAIALTTVWTHLEFQTSVVPVGPISSQPPLP